MTSEEEKTQGNIQEDAGKDTGEGDSKSTSSIVEQADALYEKLAKKIEEAKALTRRQEEILAKQTLGGRSGNIGNQEQKKEDTPKEFLDKFMKGEVKFPR